LEWFAESELVCAPQGTPKIAVAAITAAQCDILKLLIHSLDYHSSGVGR
jgi:hypothetical protein